MGPLIGSKHGDHPPVVGECEENIPSNELLSPSSNPLDEDLSTEAQTSASLYVPSNQHVHRNSYKMRANLERNKAQKLEAMFRAWVVKDNGYPDKKGSSVAASPFCSPLPSPSPHTPAVMADGTLAEHSVLKPTHFRPSLETRAPYITQVRGNEKISCSFFLSVFAPSSLSLLLFLHSPL